MGQKRGAARGVDVPAFRVMDILARANALEAEGRSVIHMEIGQPSAPVPPCVIAAADAVLQTGRVAYSDACGLAVLRERIAQSYQDRHGLEIDPARVVVTTGSSSAFMLAFLAALPPGARIGLTVPYYAAYPNIMRALGMEPVLIPTAPETGYALDADSLGAALSGGLDALLLASPANPTGTVLDHAALRMIADRADAAGIRIVSDEIYHGITYGDPAPTMLLASNEAVIVNSFSKYYCMAGWRIGWLVLPDGLVRPVEKLAQNLCIAPPTLGQHAAAAAFAPDATAYYDGLVAGYGRSRAVLMEHLPKLGFTGLSPAQGAFYLYADIEALDRDAERFCARLLEEAGVAITPGTDFDTVEGRHRVRFSFAGAEAAIKEGVDRLDAWLSRAR